MFTQYNAQDLDYVFELEDFEYEENENGYLEGVALFDLPSKKQIVIKDTGDLEHGCSCYESDTWSDDEIIAVNDYITRNECTSFTFNQVINFAK